jgi:phenylalanyl-tRNA synthetase beta chain
MRSSLLPGLLESIRYNVNRKNNRIRIFEVGTTFQRNDAQVDSFTTIAKVAQSDKIAAAAYGFAVPEQWGNHSRLVDYFDVKADLEALMQPLAHQVIHFQRHQHPLFHPGRSAQLQLNHHAIGYIGELHPRWQQLFDLPYPAVLFEVSVSALMKIGLPEYHEVSKFPPVIRDIAFVVAKTIPVQAILSTMQEATSSFGKLVREVKLFDIFQPAQANAHIGLDEKSLAFRITLQDNQSTLQDDKVERIVQMLFDSVQRSYNARLRN